MAVLLLLFIMVGQTQASTTVVTYYYTDPQGTVLATADASGNLLTNADYRPYGVQTLGNPVAGPGYTGHVNDADVGLVYMQARYYDPVLGRFLSVDPANGTPADLFSQNRYSYASNNPVGNIDPNGKESACVSQASRCGNIGQDISGLPGRAADAVDVVNNEIIVPIIGANPVAFEEVSAAATGVAGALRALSYTKVATIAAEASEVPSATASLPRMRVFDTTAKGAGQQNYHVNWTLDKFENNLQNAGFSSEANGPVKIWSDAQGVKTYTTRSFSSSEGPTAELFNSTQRSAVAKIRFDQNYSP